MKVVKLFLALQVFTLHLYAQISGNSTVQVYTIEQYTLNQGTIYSNPRWAAIGGVIQSETRNVTTYTITVKWDVQGAGKVNFLNENVLFANVMRHQNPINSREKIIDAGKRGYLNAFKTLL